MNLTATPSNKCKPASLGIKSSLGSLQIENIASLAVRAQELGDVIPLWYGESDVTTPEFILNAIKAALDEGLTFYIPDMHGHGPLKQALEAYQSHLHGRAIAQNRTTVTPGGMQALYLALQLIVEPGDEVVYIEPQWPNIQNAIRLCGGAPRPFALDFTDAFQLDLDRLFVACNSRTRAIFLSSPSNPTGWTARYEEMQALLEFSRRTGVWILSDEVYARLYVGAPAAPSILQCADPEDRALAINSFSKAWAMTGLRIGWLTHPASVASMIGAMTQYINSGTSAPIQAGAAAALRHGEAFVAEMRSRIDRGMTLAYDQLGAISRVRLPKRPSGGMYVFFSLDGENDSARACATILEKARVGLAPGKLFGASASAFLRMCICRNPQDLQAALNRMSKAIA